MLKTKKQYGMIFTILLFLFSFGHVIAKEYDPIKNNIIQYIDANTNQQIQFLEKIVNINSGTDNLKGVQEVGKIFQQEFKNLGFKVRWVDMPKSMDRAGHLIAQHEGTKGNRVLLLGHLDTVFSPDDPFQKFSKNEKLAIGPGVIDSKGGDSVILYALKALQEVGALKDASITVILTGDEENTGKPIDISRKLLQHAAEDIDVALEFEWADSLDAATVARRGQVGWLLSVEGKADHSYLIFDDVNEKGAIYLTANILNTFYKTFSDYYGISVNPGLIAGGASAKLEKNQAEARGKKNIIASKLLVSGDMRYISEQQKWVIMKQMQRIVYLAAGKSAKIEFSEKKLSIPLTLKNQELLLMFSDVSEELGYGKVEALDPLKRGASDLSYVASIVPANLAGLGPVGTGAHSPQETLELDSLPIATKRAAIFIYDLINE